MAMAIETTFPSNSGRGCVQLCKQPVEKCFFQIQKISFPHTASLRSRPGNYINCIGMTFLSTCFCEKPYSGQDSKFSHRTLLLLWVAHQNSNSQMNVKPDLEGIGGLGTAINHHRITEYLTEHVAQNFNKKTLFHLGLSRHFFLCRRQQNVWSHGAEYT